MPSTATVELDAFSGRPNPRWQLSADEARDLSARLLRLQPARRAKLADGGLGYRGFYIENANGQRIHIAHGLIAFPRGGHTVELYHDAYGAEAALQAQARARGYGAVFGTQR